MKTKIFAGLLGLALYLAFLAPPLVKLKDPALAIVILIGVAVAVYEFIEVARGKED